MSVDSNGKKTGYIKVDLDYAPRTNGKKFAKWCEEHGFTPIGSGRRAWAGSLSTYLRDASGVAYADGEPFLFYEEDLVDIEALIKTEKLALLERVEQSLNNHTVPESKRLVTRSYIKNTLDFERGKA